MNKDSWMPQVGKKSSPVDRFILAQNVSANIFLPADYPANTIDNAFLDNLGVQQSNATYYISKAYPVEPLANYVIGSGPSAQGYNGGWYNGGTWLANLVYGGSENVCVAPASATHVRINVSKSYATDYQVFIRKIQVKSGSNAVSSMTALGDSITSGASTVRPYWLLAGDKLGCTTFTNRGIGGSTVSNAGIAPSSPMVSRLATLVEADIMLFQGGGNDFKFSPVAIGTIADVTDISFYGALNVIAAYLVRKFPFSKHVWCTTPKWQTGNTANSVGKVMSDYMDAVVAVANKHGFVVVDAAKEISYDIADWPMSRVFSNDGIHPNLLAGNYWANMIVRKV